MTSNRRSKGRLLHDYFLFLSSLSRAKRRERKERSWRKNSNGNTGPRLTQHGPRFPDIRILIRSELESRSRRFQPLTALEPDSQRSLLTSSSMSSLFPNKKGRHEEEEGESLLEGRIVPDRLLQTAFSSFSFFFAPDRCAKERKGKEEAITRETPKHKPDLR